MTTRNAAYWTMTILIALAMLGGGTAYVSRLDAVVEGVTALGYPTYFITMLGIGKISAALTVLAPRLPRLKEWAYAGITFNLLAAAISHAVRGDPAVKAIVPLIIMSIGLASWALRPASRRLGPALFEPATASADRQQIATANM
ncbi:MAG: hypothetical protein JWP89_5813 [Schlesneria sp.]|nr:hypothetical protein [Schlesneria sp.]